VDLMTIGEFARSSRLSPKSLRLYDELGLLRPVRIDPSSGYRYYDDTQLEAARLVAVLRRLDVPLVEIQAILGLDSRAAADRITAYWSGAEAKHSEQRDLVRNLVARLNGTRTAMNEVTTTEIPERSLLCLKRNVDGEAATWALGKEFMALMLDDRPLPWVEGRVGAVFCIYWGEVNDDGDGPLEWCRPVPTTDGERLAREFPELTLRVEPEHREAYIALGKGGQISPLQWQVAIEALHAWARASDAHPIDLGVRVTYIGSAPATPTSGPDCDFAVPVD